VRYGLVLGAAMALALVGVAQAETGSVGTSTDASRAVVAPGGVMPLLQTTPTAVATNTPVPATATAASTRSTPAAANTPPPAATVTVTVKDFEFSPPNLTIKVGDTVLWSNSGPAPHTATSRNGVWDTGELKMGESSYFTFNQPGSFAYFCAIHPRMRGVISVEPEPRVQTGSVGGMAIYSGGFDGGYSSGYGYAGPNPYGMFGQSSLYTQQVYTYDPRNGYYYAGAGAASAYPYSQGYGAWWGGQYGMGYPFSYLGGYGYPGYQSANYPYYGGGGYYPYSYYPYGSAYSGANPYGYYPYGYQSPYSSLYYSYYRYPYSSAFGYTPYSAYNSFYPYYANSNYLYSYLGYYSPYSYYGYGYSPYAQLTGGSFYGSPYFPYGGIGSGYPFSYLGTPYIY
jgi:plastocyanin